MVKMMVEKIFLIFTTLSSVTLSSQNIFGRTCTISSTGASGTCTLLTNCKTIRNELLLNQRLPENLCGFQGTQVVVCCPNKDEKRPGDISKRKCKEYSKYADKNECDHKIVKRIIGGELAGRKEFPHMALLGYKNNLEEIKWGCGGSIISEYFILTLARCVSQPNLKSVLVGVTNREDTNNKQLINVQEKITHPKYRAPRADHDIGLIKLETAIQLNSFARPGCLYTESKLSIEETIATGWGFTESGKASKDLLKVTLSIADATFCNMSSIYKQVIPQLLENGVRDDIFICTNTEGKDTCKGDSGGPLQIRHELDGIECMYDIVGLTSLGARFCGDSTPSLYTRVSPYVDWIEKIVWPDNTTNT